VLIAATAGTVRHALALEHALRPLFAYLRAVVVPTAVFAATEDWANGTALDDRIDRAAGELADLIRAAAARRHTREADVVPFARLLARGRA
jgi:FMN reductase